MSIAELMKQMQEKYIADLKTKPDELVKLVAQNEQEILRNFFHKLKGSGSTYGLPQVTDYGRKFEEKLKSGSYSTADLEAAIFELKNLINTL